MLHGIGSRCDRNRQCAGTGHTARILTLQQACCWPNSAVQRLCIYNLCVSCEGQRLEVKSGCNCLSFCCKPASSILNQPTARAEETALVAVDGDVVTLHYECRDDNSEVRGRVAMMASLLATSASMHSP